MPDAYRYDGSFEGLLCVAVAATRRGDTAPRPLRPGAAGAGELFGAAHAVDTCGETAARVLRVLRDRGGDGLGERLRRVHHATHDGADRALARLVPRLAREGPAALDDYGCDAAVLAGRLHKAVCREIHRMHAFVRFEAQAGGTWAARVAPAHDVLPFIGAHFAGRYPQMRWAIYDTLRGYAIAYAPVDTGARGNVRILPATEPPSAPAPDEAEQQRRWRAYIEAVTIPARANPRLQRQHVPLRYRPLLSEFNDTAVWSEG